MNALRIAFLTPEYVRNGFPEGGLANYLSKICPLLQERGHYPVVFLLGLKNRKKRINGIQVLEIKQHYFSPYGFRKKWKAVFKLIEQRLNAVSIAKAFRTVHADQPFDIIQSPSYKTPGYCLAGGIEVPFAVRISSFTPLWRAALEKKTTLMDRLFDRMELRQIKRADTVFAPSRLLAGYLNRRHINTEVVRTPHCFPRPEACESVFEKHLAGKRYLLFFGKLDRRKGVDTLADALPHIFQRFPNIHVAFAGLDYSEAHPGRSFGQYAQTAAGSRRHQIHLLGNLPKTVLMPIIKNADLVVLPSRIDNYPNTCLEAQALGKIVIGTNGSSLDEMIIHNETGFLCQSGSPKSLASCINQGLSLSAMERDRIEQAVCQVRNSRANDTVVEDLIRFYYKTIDKWRKQNRPDRLNS